MLCWWKLSFALCEISLTEKLKVWSWVENLKCKEIVKLNEEKTDVVFWTSMTIQSHISLIRMIFSALIYNLKVKTRL